MMEAAHFLTSASLITLQSKPQRFDRFFFYSVQKAPLNSSCLQSKLLIATQESLCNLDSTATGALRKRYMRFDWLVTFLTSCLIMFWVLTTEYLSLFGKRHTRGVITDIEIDLKSAYSSTGQYKQVPLCREAYFSLWNPTFCFKENWSLLVD